MNNEKIEIASELLKNTSNLSLSSFLDRYIYIEKNNFFNEFSKESDVARFNKCIEYLIEAKFNMLGWELIYPMYSFYNSNNGKIFILEVLNLESRVIPIYLDENFDKHEAKSIKEAIKKYYKL